MKYLLLFFIPFIGLSQNCNFTKDYIDEFTNDKIKSTNHQILSYGAGQHEVVRFQSIIINNQKIIRCYLVLTNVFNINKGDAFILLANDKTKLTLYFSKSETANYNQQNYNTRYNTSWYIVHDFKVNQMEISTLLSKNFTKLRYYTSKGYIQHNIKPKHLKKIKRIINCLID